MWLVDLGEVQWPLPSLLFVDRKIYEPRLPRKGGAISCFALCNSGSWRCASSHKTSVTPAAWLWPAPANQKQEIVWRIAQKKARLELPREVRSLPESTQNNAISTHAKGTANWSYRYDVSCCFRRYCVYFLSKKPLIPVFALLSSLPRPGNGPQDLNGRMKQQTGSEISGEREAGSPARRGPWGQTSTPPLLSVSERETNLGGWSC